MAAETPTVVLVHGAWADATGFDAEIRALQRQGFRAIGFANPLRDLAEPGAALVLAYQRSSIWPSPSLAGVVKEVVVTPGEAGVRVSM